MFYEKMIHLMILSLSILFFSPSIVALDNGLALTPPMGVSTWSIFRTNVNHTLIVDLADSMVKLGLKDAGYEYLLMDAGWAIHAKDCPHCLPYRDRDGNLNVDTDKFPSLKDTIDQVHSKGLLFGIWFGHDMCQDTDDIKEDIANMDAEFFASVGVDAVKHDTCGASVPNSTQALQHNFEKYEHLGIALNRTGRPMLYDVTLQVDKSRTIPSYDYNYIWSPEPYGMENVQRIANMWWSVPCNKFNCWQCCVHPNEYIVPDEDCWNPNKQGALRGLLPYLDIQDQGSPGWSGHWDWAGRGKGWNHLDQLGVCVGESWYGPGLSQEEQRTQISLWAAILGSPLIVSVDTRSMKHGDDCHQLITNPRMLRVHQDPLGIPGRRMKNNYRNTNDRQKVIDTQIWARPLTNGAVAAVFLNRAEEKRTFHASFEDVGLLSSVNTATSTSVWTGEVIHGLSSPITVSSVPPHGVAFLILTPEGSSVL